MALGGHDVSEHLCLGGLVALRRKEWVEGGAVGAPWFRTALISIESAAPEFDEALVGSCLRLAPLTRLQKGLDEIGGTSGVDINLKRLKHRAAGPPVGAR
jgi:hypothetical protein